MIKIERTETPNFLKDNYKKWGREYKENKFQFSKHNKYNEIRKHLELLTNNHCSFCDGHPLGAQSRKTVEHFRPKSKFPLLAFVWHNLFICCDSCQSAKGDKFDKKLLKPDRDEYCFSHFFIYIRYEGKIKINPNASNDDQQRAGMTIELYDLNRKDLMDSRKLLFKYYKNHKRLEINDMPYRFMFL